MTAIGIGFALLGGIALLLGFGVWYYRDKAVDLRAQVQRGETAGEALEVERDARTAAEADRNAHLEEKWAAEAEEAKHATDTDAALARWGRVLRRLGVQDDDRGPGGTGTP
jgi:hypothetical protein